MQIGKVIAAYGVLKENVAALESKLKVLRPHIDDYLEAHPAEKTSFGEWDLICSQTERIVTDMKKLEKKIGKRALKECQRAVLGQQIRVIRAKQLDLDELGEIKENWLEDSKT